MSLSLAFASSINFFSHAPVSDWNIYSSSLLLEVSREEKIFTCSAVAIAKNVVITAAHCVDDITSGSVLLGHDYKEAKDKIGFKSVHIHHGYNQKESFYKDDIAVIVLKNNLPHEVKKANIDWNLKPTSQMSFERIGFGGRNNENRRTWTNPSFLNSLSSKILEFKDQCSVVGDSGGPIYANTNDGLKLIAIHSTLEGSEKTYSSYLPYYKDWISSVVPLKVVTSSSSSMHR